MHFEKCNNLRNCLKRRNCIFLHGKSDWAFKRTANEKPVLNWKSVIWYFILRSGNAYVCLMLDIWRYFLLQYYYGPFDDFQSVREGIKFTHLSFSLSLDYTFHVHSYFFFNLIIWLLISSDACLPNEDEHLWAVHVNIYTILIRFD